MKAAAHFRTTGRGLAVLVMAVAVSCSTLGSAGALGATRRAPTQAQKLAKALKACRHQPQATRAACVRRAHKRYPGHPRATTPKTPVSAPGPVGPNGPLTPTAPVSPVTSTSPVTPSPPVTATPPAPPAGSVAPPGPTLAWLQLQLCAHSPCGATHQILNLTMIDAGAPRLGSGVSRQRGGDDVPSDTWIYPLHYSYDSTASMICYVASSYCTGDLSGISPVFFTETTHWREKSNALLSAAGLWVLRAQAASTTCDPDPGACTYLGFGGGA